jgi:hypothetical protein
MGEVRRISSGFQQELKTAFDETDVDEKLPRRRESAPLAAAVADAEAEARAPEADAPADMDELPSAARPLAGDGPTVAPAVAAALDEIVTPLSPAPASPAAAATNGSRDHETGDAGDERAAS